MKTKPVLLDMSPESDTFATERPNSDDFARRGILVRVSPAIRRELKLLATSLDTSVQNLMLQCINDLLAKHGRPPIA